MRRVHIEEIIHDLGERFGFDHVVAVGKGDFVDIQVLLLPAELRSRGIGSTFLSEVCAAADRLSETLGLYPEPSLRGWTEADRKRLIEWYRRYGFEKANDDSVYRGRYVRLPKTRAKADSEEAL